MEVVCIGRNDGAIRWRRDVAAETIETGHPSFNPASSTPAADGERVVVYFGSCGLLCYDHDGNKLWEYRLPVSRSYAGNATSPIIAGDRVILYRGNYDEHYLLAVDKHSGKELWKTPLTEKFTAAMACTSCPIAAGEKLIVHAAQSIQAFEINSGKRIWHASCSTTATSTPVLSSDEVIVATWNQTGEPALTPSFPPFAELVEAHDEDASQTISREEFPKLMWFHRADGTEAPQNGAPLRFAHVDRDKNGEVNAEEWKELLEEREQSRRNYVSHGLVAIPLDSEGTVAVKQMRTLARQGIPEVPSPLCHEGYVYYVKNGGVLTCLELATGNRVYRKRTQGTGTHYASPIIADGKLYTIAGNGRVTVLSLGPQPKILATNEMGEAVFATPAVVAGTLYVRTPTKLFAFAARSDSSPRLEDPQAAFENLPTAPRQFEISTGAIELPEGGHFQGIQAAADPERGRLVLLRLAELRPASVLCHVCRAERRWSTAGN